VRLIALARAAFEAQGLHLRRVARARGIQAALAATAAVFAVMLLLMLHVAAFAALVEDWGAPVAALLVAAGDLVLVLIIGIAAKRSGHDRVAEEALVVRDEAMRQLGESAARAAMLVPLLKSQGAKKGLIGAAVTALVLGIFSRR
jgi:hypothetical protein